MLDNPYDMDYIVYPLGTYRTLLNIRTRILDVWWPLIVTNIFILEEYQRELNSNYQHIPKVSVRSNLWRGPFSSFFT